MGAVDFITYKVSGSMSAAYTDAVEDAEYEEGHNSYNGTISTTEGFKDATKEFTKLLERKREGSIKWRNSYRGDDGRWVSEVTDKRLKDMSEKEWVEQCEADFVEEAHDQTDKWGVCWGAEIAKNKYVFAGWASC